MPTIYRVMEFISVGHLQATYSSLDNSFGFKMYKMSGCWNHMTRTCEMRWLLGPQQTLIFGPDFVRPTAAAQDSIHVKHTF